MRVEFRVQGSDEAPYQVAFWREGTNLKSSCTCRAGKARHACKHRFAMLEADVTNLVSGNYEDIGKLQELIQGTDYADAYAPVLAAIAAQQLIKSLLPITPQQRRKGIDVSAAVNALREGGFAKGNGGSNYFDIYRKDLAYVGSVKTKASVFQTTAEKLFSELEITSSVKTDGLVHETSLGIYAAASDSEIGIALAEDRHLAERMKALKSTLMD